MSCKINGDLSFELCPPYCAAQCIVIMPASGLKGIPSSNSEMVWKLKSKRKNSIVSMCRLKVYKTSEMANENAVSKLKNEQN